MRSSPPHPEFIDDRGAAVVLGRELGRGGEGCVYDLVSNDNAVAKIYHNPLPPERADKIRAMTRIQNDRLEKLTAWPLKLLLRRSGEPIGLVMPKVLGHKDIHHLYSPKSRRAEFPAADWRFLVRVATNSSRAFAVIHEANCVIGDVNHGGVLVASDARVRLIDCDSFQVSAHGRRFLCEVGVPTFTPPELQGRAFSGVIRTPDHDNFGLAVLIFQLLFMGRHPFAGRYSGAGDMPIEKAIEQCRFPYGARAASVQMKPPPGVPSLSIVSDAVATLLERAFAHGSITHGRPTAREWIVALEALEKALKQCSRVPAHWHHSKLPQCPWCAMEASNGLVLFPVLAANRAGMLFDLAAFWKEIDALPHPGDAPDFSVSLNARNGEAL